MVLRKDQIEIGNSPYILGSSPPRHDVSSAGNKEFYTLLEAVGKTTGREMVLNTSFNVKGQPIVNTPQEALETFLNTGIEFLFLKNILVFRRCEIPRSSGPAPQA